MADEMSWREEVANRLEEATSLDGLAEAIREGLKIDRTAYGWWRNSALAEKDK